MGPVLISLERVGKITVNEKGLKLEGLTGEDEAMEGVWGSTKKRSIPGRGYR